MTVKDLSFWGLFKFSLILDFLIPILFMPVLLIVAFVTPEKVTFNGSHKIDILGVNMGVISGDATISSTLVLGLFFGLTGLMIQCAILYFLAQKTPLGCVKIGP